MRVCTPLARRDSVERNAVLGSLFLAPSCFLWRCPLPSQCCPLPSSDALLHNTVGVNGFGGLRVLFDIHLPSRLIGSDTFTSACPKKISLGNHTPKLDQPPSRAWMARRHKDMNTTVLTCLRHFKLCCRRNERDRVSYDGARMGNG
jgi:hypothetical protein